MNLPPNYLKGPKVLVPVWDALQAWINKQPKKNGPYELSVTGLTPGSSGIAILSHNLGFKDLTKVVPTGYVISGTNATLTSTRLTLTNADTVTLTATNNASAGTADVTVRFFLEEVR